MEQFITKLRAFQLDSEGSLFSFYKDNLYTLIEARIPKSGIGVLVEDLLTHQKTRIDTLHITSWDKDHCNYNDLITILNHLRPNLIELPPYDPETDEGRLCYNVIFKYDAIHQRYVNNVQKITKEFISSLPSAQPAHLGDVLYYSEYNSTVKNNMSLIRLYRSAGFNVLSLGDCESTEIAMGLQRDPILLREVDVLILAHHGAENSVTSADFLDAMNPRIAVCSSNYDNRFDHPTDSIRKLLASKGIPLMTTKRGDIIIIQKQGEQWAYAYNLVSNNEKTEDRLPFKAKRHSENQKAA